MKTLILILLFISPLISFSSVQQTGAMEFLSLSYRINPIWGLSFYHYDTFAFEKKVYQGRKYEAGIIDTYFQTSLSYQFDQNIVFNLGHIFQEKDPLHEGFQNEHRIFEQVTFLQRLRYLNISHRFRYEQRFTDNRNEDRIDFRTRLRYQIGLKIPLRGIILDSKEFYFNTYNEFYLSTTGARNAFYSDNWYYAALGYQTENWGSFEMGPLIQTSVINRDKDLRWFYALQSGWIYRF